MFEKVAYKNIVIAGGVLTGKTTLAKALSNKLGWEYLSVGEFFRRYERQNANARFFKIFASQKLNRDVDAYIHRKLEQNEHMIIEGHYQGWNARDITSAYRILLTVDPQAERDRLNERNRNAVHPETIEQLENRKHQLDSGFAGLYGSANYLSPEYFQLVIDTTGLTADQTLEYVLGKLV